MQEEYTSLKEENYQLKNQISELKNAFDLNRDILKIISDEAKSKQPRIQMLYQIITRLTSINNQVMISTADLILQKNQHKLQVIFQQKKKQTYKRQNSQLKERLNHFLQQQITTNQSIKINQLNVYFKNKISQLQEEIKSLQEDRIMKQQQIALLNNKIAFFQHQQQKKSLIPTVDKKINQLSQKIILPEEIITPIAEKQKKKHITSKQTKLEIKMNIMKKELWRLRIYTEQLQYRLLTLIKVLDLEDDIKKTSMTTNTKTERRKCLEVQYDREMVQVKLLKFALNNLVKQQGCQNKDMLFNLTNRNFNVISRYFQQGDRTRRHYLYKSVEKENKVRMKPIIVEEQNDQDESIQQ